MTSDEIRNISVAVYKLRLGDKQTKSMLAKDDDGGKKLRDRASSYDPLTKAYLKILGEPQCK